ncbi:DNA-directed RNA polymerase subunit delta [Paenibacillus sp. NEAU-GSW1]|uniref:DNA-directed RNA polymerase subunit delta n=1 Tax=Paenibacillus sp. NEAU-GSW1 TaxID=2682486 RepID=UPI0012E2EC48|nr:DNA-directed RNA polymerase subunit delta [Paenibacillus sp. NEAU-GSW1]MUT67888.1 DNA-directed RNA polymerase subunit delta [Paenibacillus sp. NEAU-GSW1]
MSSGSFALKLDPERVKEMPMVDLAFEVLKAANTPYYYRDLMMEIAKIRGLSADEINQVIAQVYTEINIDGRFACVGSNMWGLKRWYPVERSEDPISNAKRPRIINDDDELEDDDLFADEEDDSYAAEDEDYDSYDEDREFEEAEEESEVDEEVGIDEEEIDEEIADEELADDEDADSEEEDYDDDEDADDDDK